MDGLRLGKPVAVETMAWPISFLLAILSLGSVSVADVPDLKIRAASGDPNAQISLGIAYRDGKGVTCDYVEALAWFRKAAKKKGNAAALDNLGWMYEHGFGTTADIPVAAKYYRASADKGHSQGQWNLGRMYAETSWGQYDNAEAARWYRRAAEGGHGEAQYRLGLASLQGMGVPADDARACQWFRKAAELGNFDATLALGTMYCLGRGVEISEEQARVWFTKATHSHDSRADRRAEVARFAQKASRPRPFCLPQGPTYFPGMESMRRGSGHDGDHVPRQDSRSVRG